MTTTEASAHWSRTCLWPRCCHCTAYSSPGSRASFYKFNNHGSSFLVPCSVYSGCNTTRSLRYKHSRDVLVCLRSTLGIDNPARTFCLAQDETHT